MDPGKTDEREKTIYGQYYWNDYDESILEEMWKDGKSIEEIADALTRRLQDGYERSEGAVRVRIKKLGIPTNPDILQYSNVYQRFTDYMNGIYNLK